MSTKGSLKYERDEATGQQAHLYQDVFDEEHVYLELEGFPFEVASSVELSGKGLARVAIRLPQCMGPKAGFAGAGMNRTPDRMLLLAPTSLPSLFLARPAARTRLRDFFSSHLRNPNTRRAYREAVRQFSAFCAEHGIEDLVQVEPIHVAAFVEAQLLLHSKPTVKQRLAALRMLFDWMVVGQVIPTNPAHAVRGPKHTQRKGKTPVLAADEARALIDAIDTDSLPGLRDRALIGLMVYTFARVGAAVTMRIEDYFVQGRRGWVRLHEKGGKEHVMPAHHNLDRYLEEYIAAAGIAQEKKSPLFRTTKGRSGELTENALLQSDVWRMIRRRAQAAGIRTEIGCHTFRATGITAYLKNGGRLEIAQQMANHESARTTGLYDRRDDEVSLDEVERIGI